MSTSLAVEVGSAGTAISALFVTVIWIAKPESNLANHKGGASRLSPLQAAMAAVLPGNENGGRVITGNYLEITITMEITWKL